MASGDNFNLSSSTSSTTSLLGESPVGVAADPRAQVSLTRALDMEKAVVEYTEGLYTQVTEERDYQREVRQTLKIIKYLDSEQWAEGERYTRHRPVLNKTRRHFFDQVGLLTDLSLDFQTKLWDKLNDYSDFERLLNQLLRHWAMDAQVKFEYNLYDMILYGLLHTGPAKIQWNSSLAGGLGDVQMVPIAPWQWGVLGAGTDPAEAECIMYFPVVTRDHIARKFGRPLADRVQYDTDFGGQLTGQLQRPGRISAGEWAKMNQALRTSLGIRRSSPGVTNYYPMALQKEFWLNDDSTNETSVTVTMGPHDSKGNPSVNWAYRVEPGEALYPRGRIITTAGGVVLEDSPNPYWHARKPFSVFRPFRVPWKMSGDMMMKPWMAMNSIINRIYGGLLDMINAIIEPTLIAPKGAFPPADWDALDPGAFGGKIKYNNNAPKAPEFAKRIGGDYPMDKMLNMAAAIEKELDMNSGAAAMQQALNKKQVPGGDTLEMILSSRSLPVRVESKALAGAIEEGGTLIVADMLQFYTVAHRVSILGQGGISASDYRPVYGEARPHGMRGEDFVRRFMGTVRRDTLLQSEKDRKLQIAIALLKMGKLSDRMFFRMVDENFDYEMNKLELLDEAKTKMLVAAAAQALSGKSKEKAKEKGK